jgi:hypothetical protein
MVLTLKLVSLACNYADAGKPDFDKLAPEHKERAVQKLPSLLEYFGYCYFYASFLAGPPAEFGEYIAYVNGSQFNNKECNGRPPLLRAFPWLLRKAFETVLCLAITTIGSRLFPLDYMLTAAFAAEPLWLRILRVFVYAPSIRIKYYFGWKLAEMSFLSCGMSFMLVKEKQEEETSDGKVLVVERQVVRWSRFSNVNAILCEFPENVREQVGNWNTRVGDWLRLYVYMRAPKGVDPTLQTYVVSAFWHGFYPGYYHFFVASAILTIIAREVRRVVRPVMLRARPLKVVYDVLTWATTVWCMNYFGVSFVFLTADSFLHYYSAMSWCGHIFIAVGFLVAKALAAASPRPRAVRPVAAGAVKKTD